MDTEETDQSVTTPPEREFVLQWGKRLRCVRGKNPNLSSDSNGGFRRRTASRFMPGAGSEPFRTQLNGFSRGSETSNSRSPLTEGRKSVSPDKEDRYYTTRGSLDENHKPCMVGGGEEKGGEELVWPKLCVTLSMKEKEEDFLAMKGSKLPHRPKKRAKPIQRTVILVSPGTWLPELCQERYEVRERKTSKKRPKGLKAMGGVAEGDSE